MYTLSGICLIAGCARGPKTPDWNPDVAADACLTQYDTNRDGFLNQAELDASPPLKHAASYLDTDQDKQLSREEILERIRTYQDVNVNMQALVEVTVRGQKLTDAEIEFVPEEFLAGFIETATGTMDKAIGLANMTSKGAPFDAVHVGLYRVKITSPSVTVKKEYNEETTLGCEVSPVMGPGLGGTHKFEVKIER